MCAAISQRRVLHRHAILGPYNTMLLLGFLDGLRERVFQLDQREPAQPVQPCYVVVWDNVSFHHSALLRDWFTNNPRFSSIFLPAYSLFLNPIEEFFRQGDGKYMTENLTSVLTFSRPWKKPAWIFQLMCARVGSGMQEDFTPAANIACDVDEVLWLFPDQRQDAGAELLCSSCEKFFSFFVWGGGGGHKQHNLLPVFVVLL